jgi:eukaryotic-like serine/threonine-protein kinase
MNLEVNLSTARYKLLEILGEGGIGKTYKAFDHQTDQAVAVKVISLQQLSSWKMVDLFEREVRVLSQLDHPAIPKYLDSFEVDTETDRLFYIVQTLAPGQTLAQAQTASHRLDEATVSAIAAQILEILVYLQALTPPIIHRDIKPQNILQDAEGEIYLVDFGAVQDSYRHRGGSTVVGTFGYMAPEQFRGQATLATDLYGLGATLVFLLSGQDPIDLPQTADLKLNLASLKLSPQFRQWLNRLIAPAAEQRFPSASLALLALQNGAQIETTQIPYRPKQTQVTLLKTEDTLKVKFFIPKSQTRNLHIFLVACLVNQLIIFILFWLFSDSDLSEYLLHYAKNPSLLSLKATFLAFNFIAVLFFGIRALQILYQPTVLYIDKKWIRFKGNFHPLEPRYEYRFGFNQIQDVHLKPKSGGCILQIADRPFHFGKYLSLPEQRWLIYEIQQFIHRIKETSVETPKPERIELSELE